MKANYFILIGVFIAAGCQQPEPSEIILNETWELVEVSLIDQWRPVTLEEKDHYTFFDNFTVEYESGGSICFGTYSVKNTGEPANKLQVVLNLPCGRWDFQVIEKDKEDFLITIPGNGESFSPYYKTRRKTKYKVIRN